MVESHTAGGGLLYVIQGLPESPVKIGFSRSLHTRRLSTLQGASPYPLRLLTSAPGTMVEERAVHAALASERLLGEWFAWQPRTIRFVEHLSTHLNVTAAIATIAGTSTVPQEWDTLVVGLSDIPIVFNLRGLSRTAFTAALKAESAPAPVSDWVPKKGQRLYRMGDIKRWLLAQDIPHFMRRDAGRYVKAINQIATRSPGRGPDSNINKVV